MLSWREDFGRDFLLVEARRLQNPRLGAATSRDVPLSSQVNHDRLLKSGLGRESFRHEATFSMKLPNIKSSCIKEAYTIVKGFVCISNALV